MPGPTDGLLFRKSGNTWSGVGDRNGAFSATGIVAVTARGDSAWAVQAMYSRWPHYGDGGRVLKSSDGGVTWKEARVRTWDTDLLAIAFADANTGWAVGSQKDSASATYLDLNLPNRKKRPLILATTNGGDHDWHEVNLSSLNLPEGALTDLAIPAPDTVVACGENGMVLRGTYAGGGWTWNRVAAPLGSYHGVAMKGATGWIVGDGGKILQTTDAGRTWAPQSSGTSLDLLKVFALDAEHAWATTGKATLFRTTDGGNTWQALSLGEQQKLRAVNFASASEGQAIGGGTVYATTDGGATWSPEYVGPETVWRVNYLVCRLDAYQVPALADGLPMDIKRMIDDAAKPDKGGRFVLDQNKPRRRQWVDGEGGGGAGRDAEGWGAGHRRGATRRPADVPDGPEAGDGILQLGLE